MMKDINETINKANPYIMNIENNIDYIKLNNI